MKKLVAFSVIVIIFFESCSSGEEGKAEESGDENTGEQNIFSNPLLSNGADPWVLKHGDIYYYTHTTGINIKLRATKRMESLKETNVLNVWTPPPGEEYSHQIWAPELHYIDEKWYMYFAASHNDGTENSIDKNRRMFVLENESYSPMNTNWVLKGKVTDETDHWAIDGTVMDIDGDQYFIWSGWRTKSQPENTGRQQLYIAKMSNPWTLECSRVMISEPEYDWEQNGLVNEGPTAWKNPDGETFLFYSASGCWTDEYKIGVLQFKGENPLDPNSWVKHQHPLFEKSETNHVYGPGHNSFFKSPDEKEDWILYHANDEPGEGCGESRKPRIQKISWSENGFPVLGVPEDSGTSLKIPSSN